MGLNAKQLFAFALLFATVASGANAAIGILVSSPTNGTNYASTNVTFTLNVTGENLQAIWYDNGSANITISNNATGSTFNYNNTSILLPGNRTLTFYANNTTASLTSTSVNFGVKMVLISSATPSSPLSVDTAAETNIFTITTSNPGSVAYSRNWTLDGSLVAACANATVCNLSFPTEGSYSLVYSGVGENNQVSNTWAITASDVCANPGASMLPGVIGVLIAVMIVFMIAAKFELPYLMAIGALVAVAFAAQVAITLLAC